MDFYAGRVTTFSCAIHFLDTNQCLKRSILGNNMAYSTLFHGSSRLRDLLVGAELMGSSDCERNPQKQGLTWLH